MSKLELIKHSLTRGFTLIEVILAVFIMGIIINMVALSLPASSSLNGSMTEKAESLRLILERVSDHASMEGRIIGLCVNAHGYKFVVRGKDSKSSKVITGEEKFKQTLWDSQSWVDYSLEGVVTSDDFSEDGISLELEVGNLKIEDSDTSFNLVDFDMRSHDTEKNIPYILLYPTGEVTPFKLKFVSDEQDKNEVVGIVANEIGQFRDYDVSVDAK